VPPYSVVVDIVAISCEGFPVGPMLLQRGHISVLVGIINKSRKNVPRSFAVNISLRAFPCISVCLSVFV